MLRAYCRPLYPGTILIQTLQGSRNSHRSKYRACSTAQSANINRKGAWGEHPHLLPSITAEAEKAMSFHVLSFREFLEDASALTEPATTHPVRGRKACLGVRC